MRIKSHICECVYYVISKSLFGNRLKDQRKKLGLTQAEAAEKAGIERETWGKYERGVFMPSGDVLISFLGMGINVSDLFAVEETFRQPENMPPALSKDETGLLTHYREAADKDREMILFVARRAEKKVFTEDYQIQTTRKVA